jgi:hypothetical protein
MTMNTSKKVSLFFEQFEHPLKQEMLEVRKIILSASSKMEEDIKWGAPTFIYEGNMATFNVRAKKFVNLTFHKGSLINDQTQLLEGDQAEARVARFYSMDDIHQKSTSLQEVVKQWIDHKDNS